MEGTAETFMLWHEVPPTLLPTQTPLRFLVLTEGSPTPQSLVLTAVSPTIPALMRVLVPAEVSSMQSPVLTLRCFQVKDDVELSKKVKFPGMLCCLTTVLAARYSPGVFFCYLPRQLLLVTPY